MLLSDSNYMQFDTAVPSCSSMCLRSVLPVCIRQALVGMVPQDETLHSWGWTPLHHVVWNDHIDMAKLLLAHGADVDAADSEVMWCHV